MDLIQRVMDWPHLDASFDMLKCWYMMYIKFFKVDWSQKFWWKSSKNWHPRKKKFFSHFFTNFFVPTFSNDLKYTLITFYSMIKQRSNNFSSLSCVTVPKPRIRPQKPRPVHKNRMSAHIYSYAKRSRIISISCSVFANIFSLVYRMVTIVSKYH